MSNYLPKQKAELAIKGFVEGLGIRATSRLTGIHKDTLKRFLPTIAEKCEYAHRKNITDKTLKDSYLGGIKIKKFNLEYLKEYDSKFISYYFFYEETESEKSNLKFKRFNEIVSVNIISGDKDALIAQTNKRLSKKIVLFNEYEQFEMIKNWFTLYFFHHNYIKYDDKGNTPAILANIAPKRLTEYDLIDR